MPKIRLTAKRQATFPKRLCEEMGLKPGDSVDVEPRVIDGERVWVVKNAEPLPALERPWFGIAKRYAEKVDDHSWRAISENIAKGWAVERSGQEGECER